MDDKIILLVEDNPDDEALTFRAFQKNNITNKIDVARDGEEALDYFFAEGGMAERDSSEHPQVILLDLNLPKVSGLEVLKKIRGDERTRRIPVVVLRSSAEESDIMNCYDMGASSYIQKPVDFKKFIEVIGNMGLYWLVFNRTV